MIRLVPRSRRGTWLLAGGISNATGYLSSVLAWDPASNTWALAGSMASPRYDHAATLLQNGRVLVTGGTDGQGNYLATAELYDPGACVSRVRRHRL